MVRLGKNALLSDAQISVGTVSFSGGLASMARVWFLCSLRVPRQLVESAVGERRC
jgi:hypothetical protein